MQASPKKNISTLIEDIYGVMKGEQGCSDQTIEAFAHRLISVIKFRLGEKRSQGKGSALRMSSFGTPCERKLWYIENAPESAEPLSPQTKLKFLFGDIIEELYLFLAGEAGHTVEGVHTQVELNGLKGHRDAIIDGVLVDVKSTSKFGFEKFKYHKLESDDPFGYLDQINLYLAASQDDPALVVKGEAAFLAINKETAAICLDRYRRKDLDYPSAIDAKRALLANPEPPRRRFLPVAEGKSGNMKLQTPCNYCAFREKCYPESRTFLYSSGPVHLAKVIREPNVPEIRKFNAQEEDA